MKEVKAYQEVRVDVYIGPPGTGKTRKAYIEDPNLYMLSIGTGASQLWFDNYDPLKHHTVLFDDFYGGAIKYPTLLRYLEGYRESLPIKGGTVQKNWNRVIITSNKPVAEWYPPQDRDWET